MDYIYQGSIKIPIKYYIIAVMFGLAAGCFCRWRKKNSRTAVDVACLTAYLFLIFSSTVFSRDVQAAFEYNLTPFWSYWAIYQGDTALVTEDFFNVLMLLPVGLLLPMINEKRKCSLPQNLVSVHLSGILSISR